MQACVCAQRHSLWGYYKKDDSLSTLHLIELAVLELQPLSLLLQPGECVCLTGPSGAGKSMLLRAVADLIPHVGDAQLDDLKCSEMKPSQWRRQVGYLPAESHWWSERLGDHFPETPEAGFKHLGFTPQVMDWQVSRLSTGEKQRLALLRLLTNQPHALLLDEPTASLDAVNVRNVETMIRDYRLQHNAPIIWISHDAEQVRRVANRVFELQAGVVQEVSL
ncbi:MAG: ABC transporter ATP-binding protein [Gammaproteobacteria bacterium]